MPVIWGANKADYFLREGWTGQISLIRHDKSGFRRIGTRRCFPRKVSCLAIFKPDAPPARASGIFDVANSCY
jgi:hypothetical protein